MSSLQLVGLSGAIALATYLAFVLALLIAGRRTDARAVAGLVPDCAVLFARLLWDPSVPRWRKLLLVPLGGYLALPFDLVPDFIPIAGQLDDALVVAFALRVIVSGAEPGLVRRHWPGPRTHLSSSCGSAARACAAKAARRRTGRSTSAGGRLVSHRGHGGCERADPFADRAVDDRQGGNWISPGPVEERVREQAEQDRGGEVGIDQG